MSTPQHSWRAAIASIGGALYSAGFLLVWLCCWPLYRFLRSNMSRS